MLFRSVRTHRAKINQTVSITVYDTVKNERTCPWSLAVSVLYNRYNYSFTMDCKADSHRFCSRNLVETFRETMFFLFVSLFILSYWLYTDVFRRAYIFMDENSLHLKFFLRRKKQIPWEEIGLIDMVQPIRTCPWHPSYGLEKAKVGKGSEVRIILRQSKENGKKMRRFPKAYIISIANFSELDCYRFLNTVGEQMEKASKRR